MGPAAALHGLRVDCQLFSIPNCLKFRWKSKLRNAWGQQEHVSTFGRSFEQASSCGRQVMQNAADKASNVVFLQNIERKSTLLCVVTALNLALCKGAAISVLEAKLVLAWNQAMLYEMLHDRLYQKQLK